jgi:hypothetical protein
MTPQKKKPLKRRKEVHLEEEVVKALQEKAYEDKRDLKNYMEKVLIDKSKEK